MDNSMPGTDPNDGALTGDKDMIAVEAPGPAAAAAAAIAAGEDAGVAGAAGETERISSADLSKRWIILKLEVTIHTSRRSEISWG